MDAIKISWEKLEGETLQPGIIRKAHHGKNITMARFQLKEGSVVPSHSHINEQITTVLSGSIEVDSNGQIHVVNEGESIHFGPNVPHKVTALKDSLVMDTFSPVREDWKKGDDSYLR